MDNRDTVVFDRVGSDAADRPAGPAVPDTDLTEALAAAAPRRWSNRATPVLGAAVLVLAGFLGGVQVQQRWGESPQDTRPRGAGAFPAGLPTGLPGLPGGSGTGEAGTRRSTNGAGPGTGSTTTGTVKLVDGGTIYVETPDGRVVTVRTTGDTAVRTTRASELSAVRSGQQVTVQGGAGTDGTVTATAVTATG